MAKTFNRAIKLAGEDRTVGATAVKVLLRDINNDVLMATGTSVPTGEGYSKGAIFIKTDAASGTKAVYENAGTTASASFDLIGGVAASEITLAEGSALIGNSSGVATALDVSDDGKIIVGNGTTATSVAVSGAITMNNAGVVSMNWGSSGTPIAHTAATDEIFEVHVTNNATSGNYEPVNFNTTVTAAGMTGGRVKAKLTIDAAMGGWSNAMKADVTYGASGSTTGLGSAFVAEMTMSAGTTSGTYAPLEIEFGFGSNAPIGTNSSFIYASANGTATNFIDSGYVLNLQGLGAATSGKIFQANTAAAATHALKILIGSTPYYVMLTDQGA